jgi:hypothetical protein
MPVVTTATIMPVEEGRPTPPAGNLFGTGQVFAVGVLHIFDSLFHPQAPAIGDPAMPTATRPASRFIASGSASGSVRGRRSPTAAAPSALSGSRRRKKIDPTTCERDYQPEELEFMRALDAYKRASGRMFPTCSEILEVMHSLGYQRVIAG